MMIQCRLKAGRAIGCLMLTVCCGEFTRGADWAPIHKTLISVEENIRVRDWRYQTTTPDGHTISVVKSVLHGGKQEGVDIVTVDNGRLTVVVIPTRGMSILGVTMGEVRLGWDSPVREVVHPSLINLHDRGGLGWLDGFNEWLVRCGLEFAGHPGTDTFRDNTGMPSEQDLTLHGKIGNIPASEVTFRIDRFPPYRMHIMGRVNERSFYGAALQLDTELSITPGSKTLSLDDKISNRGAAAQEYEIIYHANFGPPLLENGASMVAAVRRVQPMNNEAVKSLPNFSRFTGPTAGRKEHVFLIQPLSDPKGDTTVLLQNADKTLGCSMHYSLEALPFLTLWTNFASRRSGYVVGIEPGTNYPFNRRVERGAGRLQQLGAGESKHFKLSYTLHDDPAEIEKISSAIKDLGEGFKPEIVHHPPVME